MPAIRRYLDPNTGDHELENGGPKNDDSQASAVVFRVRQKRGSSPSEPNIGSRIHLVKSTNPSGLRLIEAYAVECVQDLVDRKLISKVLAKATKYTGGLVRVVLSYKDANGIPHTIPVIKAVGAD